MSLSTMRTAVSYSLLGTLAGGLVGEVVTRLVPEVATSDTSPQALATTVAQVALTGVAAALAARFLDAERDPTGGVMFILAVAGSQPTLLLRIQTLQRVVADYVAKSGAVEAATNAAVAGGRAAVAQAQNDLR
jgi:hypothetical protein